MAITGDFQGIQAMKSRLDRLRVDQIALGAADRITALISAEFDRGTDPYGAAWAPLAQSTLDRGRFPPPLTDTREMREGLTLTVNGAVIKFTLEQPAIYHQFGTKRMPARPEFPVGDLPVEWQSTIRNAASLYITRVLQVR